MRKTLSCVNAASASFVQANFSDALSSLKKGSPFSPSRDINRLSVVMHPMSFYTSFMFLGGRISSTALTFDGFGRIPLRLTILPSSMPEGTPKMHFLGLSFHLYLFSALKVQSRLSIRVLTSLVLTTPSST